MTHPRTSAGWTRRTLGLAIAALPLAACGGPDDYANKPRPPAPITVAAAITSGRVDVSPRSFGAGPIVLIVANQSATAQRVMLETDEVGGDQGGIKQRTSPINPRGTAELKVDVRKGTYRLSVDGDGIRPAKLEVGPERQSAQNELLQP